MFYTTICRAINEEILTAQTQAAKDIGTFHLGATKSLEGKKTKRSAEEVNVIVANKAKRTNDNMKMAVVNSCPICGSKKTLEGGM